MKALPLMKALPKWWCCRNDGIAEMVLLPLLFLHDKLPLQTSKAHPHRGSTLCPSCQREPEEAQHFLTCTHRARVELFNDLKSNLAKTTQKLRLHPCIGSSLWIGLTSTRQQTPYPDVHDDVLPQLHPPITWQSRLGWAQLYKGRIASQWASAIDLIHPELMMNGTQVMASIQTTVWQYVLATWKVRNEHLHRNQDQLDLPNYRQAVTTLYDQRHLLPPAAQQALYQQPLDTVLELPTPRLQNWTTRGYDYFHRQLKAAKKQAILKTNDIRTYFQPKIQPTDDPHPH